MKRKSNDKLLVPHPCAEDLSDVSDVEETYEEQIQNLRHQLKQLDERTHPDYIKVKRKLDAWLTEEKQRVNILHELRLEIIDREYKKEIEICDRDCELEKRRIQDYLLSLCEELKRRLEHDKKNIELTPSGDVLDFKPAVTRKLRRRAGADIPSNGSSNFMYWGDLLLCASGWPLNAGGSKTTQMDSALPNDLRSPIPNSGAETNQENIATCVDTEYGDCVKQPRGSPLCSTESATQSTLTSTSLSTRSNLFGSLGINLFDGSLVSQLLASVKRSVSGSNSFGLLNNHGSTFSSGLYSLLSGPPSGSAAAAVAAGLMMPSALTNNPASGLAAALNSVAINLTGAAPLNAKKRRQQNAPPTAQLNLLLPENDIYADLTVIHRACAKAAAASGSVGCTGGSRKHSQHSNPPTGSATSSVESPSHSSSQHDHAASLSGQPKSIRDVGTPTQLHSPTSSCLGSPNPSHDLCPASRGATASGLPASSGSTSNGLAVWIDDGRLYCGQKCFQYGASVILEGRDWSSHRCAGTIVAIGAQDVAIRRSSDHGICRVTVQQLKQGRYSLWPAKAS